METATLYPSQNQNEVRISMNTFGVSGLGFCNYQRSSSHVSFQIAVWCKQFCGLHAPTSLVYRPRLVYFIRFGRIGCWSDRNATEITHEQQA